MPLINDVKKICQRLAPRGWGELLLAHGLDITATDLKKELERAIAVDFQAAGFEDFAPDGVRGVEPGEPSRSLLYHALASPLVHPLGSGAAALRPQDYPTLDELDTVENYIYAVAKRKLTDFPDAVVAVFAFQYRAAARSPHGRYADVSYCRTGVSRIGTAEPVYDPARRSFWIKPADGAAGLAVMPARYGVFLASSQRPRPGDAILEELPADKTRTFLFPRHKLFRGKECLVGSNITIAFLERHISEKLRRVHTAGNVPLTPGFDVDKPPFVRDSATDTSMVAENSAGSTCVLGPKPAASLVQPAKQRPASGGAERIVSFVVPKADQDNRFWTSFQISAGTLFGRLAPEYVNIRQRVVKNANGNETLQDLNSLPQATFAKLLRDGQYEAAHFTDGTCEGCVTARVGGLAGSIATRAVQPAYSLVTAPDFFPMVDQLAIADWVESEVGSSHDHFASGGPDPLCNGRLTPNPQVNLPGAGVAKPAFRRSDQTLVAIVGNVRTVSTATVSRRPAILDLSTSYLTDAASNVFAPGWDVSQSGDQQGAFYAAYGLGSPFPEDAKLCAALNSFWPAVAPDATRTFGPVSRPSTTAIPMLDVELGHHADHPAVQAGTAQASTGWDGEQGPFLEKRSSQLFVNFASKDRSDYTLNALNGQIRAFPLADVTTDEMISRMEALRACIERALPDPNDRVSDTSLFLVRAERVLDWTTRPDRGDQRLRGRGYLYEFLDGFGGVAEETTNDLRRLRAKVNPQNVFTCQVTRNAVCWRQGTGLFKFVTL